MRSLGEFESLFKRALRDKYEYRSIGLNRILLITDLMPGELAGFEAKVRRFLDDSLRGQAYELEKVCRNDFSNWSTLESHIHRIQPTFIVSYRLLRVTDASIDTSLGVYIDTLSQQTDYPILVLPNPHLVTWDPPENGQGSLIVATEHLYKDHNLVNTAVAFCPENGHMLLAHIEDEDTFSYYVKAIEKIPGIDTELAVEELRLQLQNGPGHYMKSVAEVLKEVRSDIRVEQKTGFGHLITAYRNLVEESRVRALIFQTKDDTQLAMHSLGYSLAIQFQNIPVLLT